MTPSTMGRVLEGTRPYSSVLAQLDVWPEALSLLGLVPSNRDTTVCQILSETPVRGGKRTL